MFIVIPVLSCTDIQEMTDAQTPSSSNTSTHSTTFFLIEHIRPGTFKCGLLSAEKLTVGRFRCSFSCLYPSASQ